MPTPAEFGFGGNGISERDGCGPRLLPLKSGLREFDRGGGASGSKRCPAEGFLFNFGAISRYLYVIMITIRTIIVDELTFSCLSFRWCEGEEGIKSMDK